VIKYLHVKGVVTELFQEQSRREVIVPPRKMKKNHGLKLVLHSEAVASGQLSVYSMMRKIHWAARLLTPIHPERTAWTM